MVDEAGLVIDGRVRLTFAYHAVPFFAECELQRGRVTTCGNVWSQDQRSGRRMQPLGQIEWWSVADGTVRGHVANLEDLSVGGARIHVPVGSPLPTLNSSFPIRVRLEGNVFDALATVRHVSTDGTGTIVGITMHRRDRRTSAEACIRAGVPRLALRREVGRETVCRLFSESGYLQLREACTPNKAWLEIDVDTVSRDLVFVSDGGEAVGHVSVTRAYANAWLGHQIAIDRDHPQSMDAREELYTAFSMLPTAMDGNETHLLGYYNLAVSWHQLFFTQFANSVACPQAVVVTPWDRFERRVGASLPAPVDFDGAVEPIAPEDLPALTQIARSLVPQLLGDALDLHPEMLVATPLHRAYRNTDCRRERTGFCLRENGKITGLALCEVTDRRLSLFNIMNSAQVYVLPTASEKGQLALQTNVRRFYAARDIHDEIIIAPRGTFQGTLDSQTRLEETMGCIVWSGPALRAYENYLRLHFGWAQAGPSHRRSGGRRRPTSGGVLSGRHASPLPRLRASVLEAWALWIGLETELFGYFAVPTRPESVRARLGLDASALAALLEALRSTGHLVRDDSGRYAVCDRSRPYLLPDSPTSIARSFGFLRTSRLFEEYPRLLRDGGGLELSESDWAHVTTGSSAYVEPAVHTMIARVPELSEPGVSILDVGCGRGDYTGNLVANNPSLTAVAIDPTPAVAARARRRLEGVERAEVRCCTVEDVDESFDVVLLNHVLHVVGEDAGRRLLEACSARLRPGGAIVVQELVETEANAGALFGLMLRLLFEQGEVFDLDRLLGLIEATGLRCTTFEHGHQPDDGLVIVVARRATEER